MIHYFAEVMLWMAACYLAGCPLGALARCLYERRRSRVSAGS